MMKKHAKRLVALTMAMMLGATTLTNVVGFYAEGEDPLSRIYGMLSQTVENPETAAEFTERAEIEIGQQNYDSALEDLEKARELTDETDIDALCTLWLRSASVHFLSGAYADARECVDSALACNPDSAQAQLFSAQLYLTDGDSESAVTALEKYVALSPEDLSTRETLAQLYEEVERYSDAAEAYAKLYTDAPEEDAYWINALRCQFINGDYESALTGFDAYLADETKAESEYRGIAAFLAAACVMQQGEYASAVERFRAAAAEGYDEASCYEQMVACSFEAGLYEDVVALSEEIDQKEWTLADEASYRQYVGVALIQLERNEEAVEALTKAIEANAELPGNYYYRGVALLSLERCEEAAADFTKSIEQEYQPLYSYYNRGVCRIHLNDYETALDDFGVVLEGDDADLIQAAKDVLWQLADYYENQTTETTEANPTEE